MSFDKLDPREGRTPQQTRRALARAARGAALDLDRRRCCSLLAVRTWIVCAPRPPGCGTPGWWLRVVQVS